MVCWPSRSFPINGLLSVAACLASVLATSSSSRVPHQQAHKPSPLTVHNQLIRRISRLLSCTHWSRRSSSVIEHGGPLPAFPPMRVSTAALSASTSNTPLQMNLGTSGSMTCWPCPVSRSDEVSERKRVGRQTPLGARHPRWPPI